MNDDTTPAFEGYAILELMGHRRLAGYVSEVEIAGAAMLRLDIPEHPAAVCTCGSTDPDSLAHEDHHHDCLLFAAEDARPVDVYATQFYSPHALYALTPTTEQIARQVAQRSRPTPIHQWELPRPQLEAAVVSHDGDNFDDDQDGQPF